MSAYLSIYKDEKKAHHLITLCRVNSVVEYITNEISFTQGVIDAIDNGLKVVKVEEKDLNYSFKEIENDISEAKIMLGLYLMKKDYDTYEVKTQLQEYEELIETKGKLQIIVELFDFDKPLYMTYG
jgi:hypothetical protein